MSDKTHTVNGDSLDRKIPTTLKSATFAQDLLRTLSLTVGQVEKHEALLAEKGEVLTEDQVKRLIAEAKPARPNIGDVFKLNRGSGQTTIIRRDPGETTDPDETTEPNETLQPAEVTWEDVVGRPEIPGDVTVYWENVIGRPTINPFDPRKYYTRSVISDRFQYVEDQIQEAIEEVVPSERALWGAQRKYVAGTPREIPSFIRGARQGPFLPLQHLRGRWRRRGGCPAGYLE